MFLIGWGGFGARDQATCHWLRAGRYHHSRSKNLLRPPASTSSEQLLRQSESSTRMAPKPCEIARHASGEFFLHFIFFPRLKKQNLDRYLHLNIARAPSPKKLGPWTRKDFGLFTQKNIRRNLIAADHMRQINQGTDVLHLPTAVGVLSD